MTTSHNQKHTIILSEALRTMAEPQQPMCTAHGRPAPSACDECQQPCCQLCQNWCVTGRDGNATSVILCDECCFQWPCFTCGDTDHNGNICRGCNHVFCDACSDSGATCSCCVCLTCVNTCKVCGQKGCPSCMEKLHDMDMQTGWCYDCVPGALWSRVGARMRRAEEGLVGLRMRRAIVALSSLPNA